MKQATNRSPHFTRRFNPTQDKITPGERYIRRKGDDTPTHRSFGGTGVLRRSYSSKIGPNILLKPIFDHKTSASIQRLIQRRSFASYSSYSETKVVNAVGQRFDRRAKDSGRTQSQITQAAKPSETSNERPVVLCWNCGKTGHLWRQCLEVKKLFCYVCGFPGKTSTTCQNHQRVVHSMANNPSEN